MHRIAVRFGHHNIASVIGGLFTALAIAMAGLVGFGVIGQPASAATSPKLPQWVEVWHFAKHHPPHRLCVMLGVTGHHHDGMVCRNGTAHVLPDDNPHNAPYNLGALPPWLHSWPVKGGIVIGGGTAGTTVFLDKVTGKVTVS